MLRTCSLHRPCIPLAFIFGLVMTSVMGAAAQEDSWPQFHGPNRDNLSTETGLLKKWPESGPELIWTAKKLGFGYSSVSIASGMIFTAGDIRDLISVAKKYNIKLIFTSPEFSTQSAETIAREIGGEVVLVSSLEKDYVENIRNVAQAFTRALE